MVVPCIIYMRLCDVALLGGERPKELAAREGGFLLCFHLYRSLTVPCEKGSKCTGDGVEKSRGHLLGMKSRTKLAASCKEHSFYELCTNLAQLQQWCVE